ncbi:phospholipase [Patiriisocius marinistellae]|uniref:Phospholipase n=1 Tax=Patiriisocius marinistellae TaxID=2494560 RepID=A0A5J4FZ80_9FLAO|nr:alpha/beta fold hydrolase [Patiriisocius marinistellae]GEQ86484.1 phospholipase [Patiriisocius marinistellae]
MQKQSLQLDHNYQAPKTLIDNAPVIILLHGFGSDENDLFSFAPELPDTHHIIALKAPIPMKPYGNAWYNIYFDAADGKFSDIPQAIASRDLISNCIDEIVEKYKADVTNVTLLGFSQGTILSFAVALSYPEKVKNVIGLSGYINEELLKENYAENDFSKLSIYTSHGTVDQVLPIDWARKSQPFLENLNIACEYSEFPVGHGVAPQNFYELKNWLEKH